MPTLMAALLCALTSRYDRRRETQNQAPMAEQARVAASMERLAAGKAAPVRQALASV